MDPMAIIDSIMESGVITRQQRDDFNNWVGRGGYGPRIQSHPATDIWMRGYRFGYVTRLGNKYVTVVLTGIGGDERTFKLSPRNIQRWR